MPWAESSALTPGLAPARWTPTLRRLALWARPSIVLAAVEFDEGHGRKVDDQQPVRIGNPVEHRADRGGRTEKEGARYPVDDDVRVVGGGLVIGMAGAIGVVGPVVGDEGRARLDCRRLRHAMDEKHGAEGEADDDGFGQVAEDGEQEGGEQYGGIAARDADERGESLLLDHVPGDDRFWIIHVRLHLLAKKGLVVV